MLILITDGKWSPRVEVRDGIRELENLKVERYAIGVRNLVVENESKALSVVKQSLSSLRVL